MAHERKTDQRDLEKEKQGIQEELKRLAGLYKSSIDKENEMNTFNTQVFHFANTLEKLYSKPYFNEVIREQDSSYLLTFYKSYLAKLSKDRSDLFKFALSKEFLKKIISAEKGVKHFLKGVFLSGHDSSHEYKIQSNLKENRANSIIAHSLSGFPGVKKAITDVLLEDKTSHDKYEKLISKTWTKKINELKYVVDERKKNNQKTKLTGDTILPLFQSIVFGLYVNPPRLKKEEENVLIDLLNLDDSKVILGMLSKCSGFVNVIFENIKDKISDQKRNEIFEAIKGSVAERAHDIVEHMPEIVKTYPKYEAYIKSILNEQSLNTVIKELLSIVREKTPEQKLGAKEIYSKQELEVISHFTEENFLFKKPIIPILEFLKTLKIDLNKIKSTCSQLYKFYRNLMILHETIICQEDVPITLKDILKTMEYQTTPFIHDANEAEFFEPSSKNNVRGHHVTIDMRRDLLINGVSYEKKFSNENSNDANIQIALGVLEEVKFSSEQIDGILSAFSQAPSYYLVQMIGTCFLGKPLYSVTWAPGHVNNLYKAGSDVYLEITHAMQFSCGEENLVAKDMSALSRILFKLIKKDGTYGFQLQQINTKDPLLAKAIFSDLVSDKIQRVEKNKILYSDSLGEKFIENLIDSKKCSSAIDTLFNYIKFLEYNDKNNILTDLVKAFQLDSTKTNAASYERDLREQLKEKVKDIPRFFEEEWREFLNVVLSPEVYQSPLMQVENYKEHAKSSLSPDITAINVDLLINCTRFLNPDDRSVILDKLKELFEISEGNENNIKEKIEEKIKNMPSSSCEKKWKNFVESLVSENFTYSSSKQQADNFKAEIRNTLLKFEKALGLSTDMTRYRRIGHKEGGANASGKLGGRYLALYQDKATGLFHVQQLLFKQAIKNNISQPREVIAEYLGGNVMQAVAGENIASTFFVTSPEEKEPYLASIYYDEFMDLNKQAHESNKRKGGVDTSSKMQEETLGRLIKKEKTPGLGKVIASSWLVGNYQFHTSNVATATLPNIALPKEGKQEFVSIDFGGATRRPFHMVSPDFVLTAPLLFPFELKKQLKNPQEMPTQFSRDVNPLATSLRKHAFSMRSQYYDTYRSTVENSEAVLKEMLEVAEASPQEIERSLIESVDQAIASYGEESFINNFAKELDKTGKGIQFSGPFPQQVEQVKKFLLDRFLSRQLSIREYALDSMLALFMKENDEGKKANLIQSHFLYFKLKNDVSLIQEEPVLGLTGFFSDKLKEMGDLHSPEGLRKIYNILRKFSQIKLDLQDPALMESHDKILFKIKNLNIETFDLSNKSDRSIIIQLCDQMYEQVYKLNKFPHLVSSLEESWKAELGKPEPEEEFPLNPSPVIPRAAMENSPEQEERNKLRDTVKEYFRAVFSGAEESVAIDQYSKELKGVVRQNFSDAPAGRRMEVKPAGLTRTIHNIGAEVAAGQPVVSVEAQPKFLSAGQKAECELKISQKEYKFTESFNNGSYSISMQNIFIGDPAGDVSKNPDLLKLVDAQLALLFKQVGSKKPLILHSHPNKQLEDAYILLCKALSLRFVRPANNHYSPLPEEVQNIRNQIKKGEYSGPITLSKPMLHNLQEAQKNLNTLKLHEFESIFEKMRNQGELKPAEQEQLEKFVRAPGSEFK